MLNQQLKFSLVFIGLGAFLGWFSHSAYDQLYNVKNSDRDIKPAITTSPEMKKNNLDVPTISSADYNKEYFIKLIKNRRFEDALLWYKDIEAKNEPSLLPVILSEIGKLSQQSDENVFKLLDVFLNEYYDNSQLLIAQGNALVFNNQIEQALYSFFLAKNYSQDTSSYNSISQTIHDFSFKVFKQFQLSKNWPESIVFYKKLIGNEPQFAFYHLAIAESYIKNNDKDKAIMHLQLITEDNIYGPEATEMLEKVVFQNTSGGIALEAQGNHYIINAIIADFYQIKLLLDTGASYSSLSSHTIAQLVRDQLAIKIGRNQVYTAGGKVDVDIYQLKKLTIGNSTVNDIVVAELDLESPSDQENNFDGLLGVNFLNQFDFSIDQKTQKLILSPKL